MRKDNIKDPYRRFYANLGFERADLFGLIKNKYNCNTVLYPGCSIHITPSFYFQHVVYVDISEEARNFFQDTQNIINRINSNKKYKQSAYIKFIHDDYTKQLTLRENNYDLLIAIYAGGITKSCKKYIKPGGIIVTNNHHNDAQEALRNSDVRLEALIRRKGRKYQVEESTREKLLKTLQNHSIPLKNMRNSNNGMEYVDNEYYFVLRKTC
ncbi:hypothetical protein SPSYN_01269 [Sporotomaculum syntrophicum]|uniref:Uncharacterized protein n=1 Tax=Sporotomaculum syntrophicum TaxID=182264 RepID=A0A9D2WPT1_9FIRM|nr:class I SAM-dependent methyltransferase [Sporotomaculum syntrophicum]KAF1085133.1 hypothetical protein SPSYN_01269 [Sporotomaculum syntrophicum]